jgi:hypothetical protein
MRNPTVVSDEHCVLKDSREPREWQIPGETDIAILPFALQLVGLGLVCLA